MFLETKLEKYTETDEINFNYSFYLMQHSQSIITLRCPQYSK